MDYIRNPIWVRLHGPIPKPLVLAAFSMPASSPADLRAPPGLPAQLAEASSRFRQLETSMGSRTSLLIWVDVQELQLSCHFLQKPYQLARMSETSTKFPSSNPVIVGAPKPGPSATRCPRRTPRPPLPWGPGSRSPAAPGPWLLEAQDPKFPIPKGAGAP